MSNSDDDKKQLWEIEGSWILRPCYEYKLEYKECKKIKSRFHQFFTEGKFLDCQSWLSNFNDCCDWHKERNEHALNNLITREKGRIIERLKNHLNNDIWEKRSEPLSQDEWNKPLPNCLLQQKSHYLTIKANEYKELPDNKGFTYPINQLDKTNFCTIL